MSYFLGGKRWPWGGVPWLAMDFFRKKGVMVSPLPKPTLWWLRLSLIIRDPGHFLGVQGGIGGDSFIPLLCWK